MTNKRSWFVFIYVLFILFCFYPYEFYSTYLQFVPNNVTYFTSVLIVITGALIAFSKHIRLSPTVLMVASVQLFGFVIVGLAHGRLGSISTSLVRMVLAIVLVSYIENSKEGLLNFYKKYNIWILIMAVLGVVAWALVTFAHFSPLYPFIERAGEATMFNYGLTFTKSDLYYTGMIRYSGFFDEPGAMAYWGLYALLINKLFIKNNRLELVLMVCLLFTFSLGYFFQLAVYLLLFLSGKSSKITWISVSVIALLVLILFANGSSDNIIFEKSFGRVTETIQESQESGSIFSVDNRSEYSENAKKQFLSNPLFGSSSSEVAIGNNIYENLATYGIFGCLFVLFPYFYIFILAIRNHDSQLLKCGIVILLGFTHRPFHSALLYYFIMYSIIAMYVSSRRSLTEQTLKA